MRGLCFRKNTPAIFEIESDLDLREGDLVSLEIAAVLRVTSALLIFAVPLVFLFAGYLVAVRFFVEPVAILGSLASAAASFLLVRSLDRRIGPNMNIRIGKKL
jgi:positive regulator of sigma E activity